MLSSKGKSRGSSCARGRRAQRLRLWLVVLLGGGLLVGCDAANKYRVLSFFFDGVPPPPGMEVAKPTRPLTDWASAVADRTGSPTTMASATQPREEEAPAILHAPYARRQCTECHSAEASFQAPIAGGETCRKCHQAFYDLRPDDWSHGPVATGQCGLCHEPHKSPYPGLLKQATPNLCFTCHDSDATLARPYHVEAGSQPCTACHDPHSAGNRLLLADSTTYQRRQSFAKALPSPHAKWDKKDCTQCHASAQSNQVLPDVDSKCLTCHAQVQAGGGPGLHDPVRQGRCTACHTPHQSTRPHLIRPTAEQICLSCHHIQQIQTPAHPPMQRADCLLCHAGHSSPRPHLLRPFAETLIEPAGDAGATTRGSAGPPP